jgi:type IX secretion system PorP/SprF family membrane protein
MKRPLVYLVFAASFFWALSPAFGQQEPQFSQYMFNSMYLNPAFAGIEGQATAQVVSRWQWLNYSASFDDGGAPNSQVIAFNTPLYKANSGVGLHIVNDRLGAQRNLQIHGNYSYHLPVGPGKLGIGVRAGIYSQRIEFGILRGVDANDPALSLGTESGLKPELGVGLWYRTKKYYVGVSSFNLLGSSFDFGNSIPDSLRRPTSTLSQHLVLTAGYFIEATPDLTIMPSAIFKTVQGPTSTRSSFEASAIAIYKEKYFGGLSFRQGDAVIALVGLSLLKDNSLRLTYSFDYVAFNAQGKAPTSHEILLHYNLPITAPGSKPIIRTPRFRH